MWGTGGGLLCVATKVASGRRWWSCRSCCCMCRMFFFLSLSAVASKSCRVSVLGTLPPRIESHRIESGRVDSTADAGSDVDVLDVCCDALCAVLSSAAPRG